MANRETANERMSKPLGVAFLILIVVVGVPYGLLLYWLYQTSPGFAQFWRDGSGRKGSDSLFFLLPLFIVTGAFYAVKRVFDRRGAAEAQKDPTPAGLWAQAHGWAYTYASEQYDPIVLNATSTRDPDASVDDAIAGQWEGRAAWAICYSGGREDGPGQAIVLRLLRPWPGEFALSWTQEAADIVDAHIQPTSYGCYVSGYIGEAQTDQIIWLLQTTGLLDEFVRTNLPKNALLGALSANRDCVTLEAVWADNPDAALPVAFGLLTRLAAILEEDAARYPAPAPPSVSAQP